MAARGGDVPGVFEKPENRMALAEELIRMEVMARQAEGEGLMREPEIRAQIRRLLVEQMERRLLEKAAPVLRVSSNEAAHAYRQDRRRYQLPAAVRAAVVLIRTPSGVSPSKRDELRARAEQARREALALPETIPHLGPVAARYSDDQATRYAGGASGWEQQGGGFSRWPEAVSKTVDGLTQTGQVSEVFETDAGFMFVKLMERRDGTVFPFETVRANVERDLAARKRQDILDRAYAEARQGVRVVIDEAALLRLPTPSAPVATGIPVNPSDD